ncbi:MAG: peptidylprolyl isomerase [Magnetococcales bacterium]|nr:peptidylprolyl isomerase [Magnetococcales bacterium]
MNNRFLLILHFFLLGLLFTSTPANSATINQIDLMVLYTPGMASNYPNGALQTRINQLVTLSNQAYVDSGINIEIRLVHTMEVDYSDTTSNETALSDLRGAQVSAFSNIAEIRTNYGADLVTLIRPFHFTEQGSCGLGAFSWQTEPGSDVRQLQSSHGFSVVGDGQDESGSGTSFCDDYTMVHELGHNLGSMHERAQYSDPDSSGLYSYSFGYGVTDQFGTIMSYIDPLEAKFSSPDLTCGTDGAYACGIATTETNSAHNVLSINNAAPQVAAFQSAKNFSDVDLVISQTESADPVVQSSNYTYTVTVSNNGTESASAVVVSSTLDSTMTFVSATPEQGSCTNSSGTLICQIGDMASGASVHMALIVQATAAGSVDHTVRVTSSSVDSDTSNNSSTESTTVLADSDADTIQDGVDNCPNTVNTDQTDQDGDGLGNACDSDDDNDGMSDLYESAYGLDSLDSIDGVLDSDGDGLSNASEAIAFSNPNIADTDGDGIKDGTDINPLVPSNGVVEVGLYTSSFTVVLTNTGRVWTWGLNSKGQLGVSSSTVSSRSTPEQLDITDVRDIAAGNGTVLAAKKDGTVWSWGNNQSGQLGDGTGTSRSTPVQVTGLSQIVAVAAGSAHSMALSADGTVLAWGWNGDGQIGNDSVGQYTLEPVQVSNISNIIAIEAGWSHSLALDADGAVWAWGSNTRNQLGQVGNTNATTPVQITALPSTITRISSGLDSVIATASDGSVYGWGYNGWGQLGTADDYSVSKEVSQITVLSALSQTQIDTGSAHTLALNTDGTLFGLGKNENGELGQGSSDRYVNPTLSEITSLSNVTHVATANDYSVAILKDGSVWTWGANDNGQLGTGNTTASSVPVQVLGVNSIGQLNVGSWPAFSDSSDNQVTITTNFGDITLQLYPDRAPVTVANFLDYLDSGFYDGLIFHRVIPGFMIQGGGFKSIDGTLEYQTPNATIVNEANNGLSNLRGTIAMARMTGADTASSQFFINVVDNTFLDYQSSSSPGYAVFGAVVDGLDVADSIVETPTTTIGYYQDVPVSPVTIDSVTRIATTAGIENTLPEISALSDQVIDQDQSVGPLLFSVSDGETAPESLTVSITSSNVALVPTSNVVLSGTGASRSVTVTPVANQSGVATVILTVSDGVLLSQSAFQITVNESTEPPVISLLLGEQQSGQYGSSYGTNAHPQTLVATFESTGEDLFLHTQAFDIDSANEVGIYLNDMRIGYLAESKNNAHGNNTIYLLSASDQITGTNRLEFRQKNSGWKWGVRKLGVYALPTGFGNMKSLTNGDTSHPAGIDLHLNGGTSGYLVTLAGFDSDSDGEVQILLNGSVYSGVPKGKNNGFTSSYQLIIPGDDLKAGDNFLRINNSISNKYNWGVRLHDLRPLDSYLGKMSGNALSSSQIRRVYLLTPKYETAAQLSVKYYDVDYADELQIQLNGTSIGHAGKTANNGWSASKQIDLPAGQWSVLDINNTYNPPKKYAWGVQVVSLLPVQDSDGDGLFDTVDTDDDNDGMPDSFEIKYGLNPLLSSDATNDDDGDGLSNLDEYRIETDPTVSDSDGDGVSDSTDSHPNAQSDTGPVIVLQDSVLDSGSYGYSYGTSSHYSRLAATFVGDGTDRLFHVQGYDMNMLKELAVFVNGTRLGWVSCCKKNGFSKHSLFPIPVTLQNDSGEQNRIELRLHYKKKGTKWGVRQLGIFPLRLSSFGNILGLKGGDRKHASGIDLHLPKSDAGYLLQMAGWDSGSDGEIALTLNGQALVGIPEGAWKKWTSRYHVVVPPALLTNTDNILRIKSSTDPKAQRGWGVKFYSLGEMSETRGRHPSQSTNDMQYSNLRYLIPIAESSRDLTLRYYDVDSATEVLVTVNGVDVGYADTTGNKVWGATSVISLPANQQSEVLIDNTLHPGVAEKWGVKLEDIAVVQ